MADNHHIRAVIWDMGGVILRTVNPTPRTQLAQRLGVTRAELEQIVFESESAHQALRGQHTEEQHWQNMARHFNLPQEEMVAFQRDFWGGDREDRALVQYIQSLRSLYRVGLLSNAWSGVKALALSLGYTFLDAFDEVVFSAEVKMAKPDPAIYRLMLGRLGVMPQQAVFIDDFQENVEGARAVGLHAIRFKEPAQALAELKQVLRS